MKHFLLSALALSLFACNTVEPEAGMEIGESVNFRSGTYNLPCNPDDSLRSQLILISADSVTVDFNGAVLDGSREGQTPELFGGVAVRVTGNHVTIKNLRAKGYKVAVYGEGCEGLSIIDSDLSDNYRQRLKSTPEREDFADWFNFYDNEADEWLQYGAAIYLKNCEKPMVKGCTVVRGENGLLLSGTDGGLFYNNNFSFNSGLGIGLYRSCGNRVMHNRLDWNIRGYSHGVYNRGQDSSGILAFEQSSDNVFAYNSATHGGDGFFLNAGASTIETGEGGSDNNLIYGNDFSYASNNALEMTFSSGNIAVKNKLNGSDYGIWGGYSYDCRIIANEILKNREAIGIEYGHGIEIADNLIGDSNAGINLWENPEKGNFGFANTRDISSRDYLIEGNRFRMVKFPFVMRRTKDVQIVDNRICGYATLITDEQSRGIEEKENQISRDAECVFPALDSLAVPEQYRVEPLADGMDAMLPEGALQGRHYILMEEFGPYPFTYPILVRRGGLNDVDVFEVLGPEGTWKLESAEGYTDIPEEGVVPGKISVRRTADNGTIRMIYTGGEVTDAFGNVTPKGKPYPFTVRR